MWLTLSDDVRRLEEAAKREENKKSFYRRQYLRAAAALVEGFISMLRQGALLSQEKFSPEELLLLQEHEPVLKDNGEASVRNHFLPIKGRIRFAFLAYAKASQAEFRLNCSRSGWQDLVRLFKIRDRLVHPKNYEELFISDDELHSTKQALDFVLNNHLAVLETIQRKILSRARIPEPLIEKWMSWQKAACGAAHAGRPKEERASLLRRFHAEVEAYFGGVKSDG
jgi:hypothetical protein